MNLQHEIKISQFIFPVIRVNNDESVIVESGGPELALNLEQHGYEWVREKYDNGNSSAS